MPAGHVKKQAVIDTLTENILEKATVAIITDYRGLNVASLSELRNELYKNNARFTIVKNTLMKRVVKGTPLEAISEYLKGPSAIIYGTEDMVAPVKILRDYYKKNKKDNEIRGGFVDGKPITPKEVQELADLPPIEELRAKLVGAIAAPNTRLVMAINSQNQSLVRALQQVAEKKQAQGQ